MHFTEPASRTHYILKEIRDVGLVGQKVDFLYDSMKICFRFLKLTSPRYIDEVQDNLLIDTLGMHQTSL